MSFDEKFKISQSLSKMAIVIFLLRLRRKTKGKQAGTA
jgi:hypothetical protein